MTFMNRISFPIVAVAWIVCTVLLSINLGAVNENPNEPVPQRLPRESSDWRTIRSEKSLYIDKTKYLKELLSYPYKTAYIARPRRFGKSLFLEMMANFFAGKKKLFHGLFIEDYGNTQFLKFEIKKCGRKSISKWMKFPVIYLDFSYLAFSTRKNFKNIFYEMLVNAGETNNVDFTQSKTKSLSSLIHLLYITKKMPVILLIDEYDKPIRDASMNNDKKLEAYLRAEYEEIFIEVKASNKILSFTFMVGMSKFPNSISDYGTNNFDDLSYDIRFAQAFGFTQEEIRNNMQKHLEEFANEMKSSVDDIIRNLLDNYSGYCFQTKGCNNLTSVLNPISTIQSLTHKQFGNYWNRTCSMKHIAKIFYKDKDYWHVNDFETGYVIRETEFFDGINDAFLDFYFPIYLFVFGYTTINKYDEEKEEITMTYPNKEIRDVIQEEVIQYVPFADDRISECGVQNQKFFTAMNNGNLKAATKLLQDYVFIRFQYPLADDVTPQEITRRVSLILYSSNINFREGVTFNKDDNETQHAGNIDFLTLNLQINMLISIKCSMSVDGTGHKALKQLTGYYENHPENFIGALKKLQVETEHLYFIGIGFVFKHWEGICEWVVLPLKNRSFDYSHLEAYPKTIKKRYQTTMVSSIKNYPSSTVPNKDDQFTTYARPHDLNDEDPSDKKSLFNSFYYEEEEERK